MPSRINQPNNLTSPSIGDNVGEDTREQRQRQRENEIINDALRDTNTTIDREHQAIPDRTGFANATNDWRNYMSNYLENNTNLILKNNVPTFSVNNGKIRISGTEQALASPIAADAKKALSSALTGVDLGTEAAQKVIDRMNESLKSSVTEYIVTKAYGFQDSADYNNYLLALQEAKKPNPNNSTYYFTAKDKNGNLVRKTFKDWVDYWRKEYSTDERADLFLNSANSSYGYDRIPYVLMSGGGERDKAVYGFDPKEYLDLFVYSAVAQISKLPHGLTQSTEKILSDLNGPISLLKEIGVEDADNLIVSTANVSEEMFNEILEKFKGHGPVKGGIDALTDREKAILALGVDTAMLPAGAGGVEFIRDNLIKQLGESNYNTFKDRQKAAAEVYAREGKMNAVNERIARNMAVYGGATNQFVSNMLGTLLRQAIESYSIGALTGGKFVPGQIGERLGEKVATAFGLDAIGEGSLLGIATGKSLATFIASIPEDLIQDLIDSKLTADPELGDNLLSFENIGPSLVYRLAFSAMVKFPQNIVKNVRAFKALSKAAKDAGYDIDADDLKRAVTEAYDAFVNGRQVGVDDEGRIVFEDEDGNLKTYDNVTVWSAQPLTSPEVDNAISDFVKERMDGLTEEWKKTKAKDIVSFSNDAIRDYISNGNYTADIAGSIDDIRVPDTVKGAMLASAIDPSDFVTKHLQPTVKMLNDFGFDSASISKGATATNELTVEKLNGLLGIKLGKDYLNVPVEEALGRFADTLKMGEVGGDIDRAAIVKNLQHKIYRVVDRWDDKIASLEKGEAPDFTNVVFGLSGFEAKDLTKAINAVAEGLAMVKPDSPYSYRLRLENDIITPYIVGLAEQYINKYHSLSAKDIVSYLDNSVEVITKNLENQDLDEPTVANHQKVLNEFISALDSLDYQMNYNRNFTPLDETVLGDIHATAPIGVDFNEQKVALMVEAKDMSASDFVFRKLQGENAPAGKLISAGSTSEAFDNLMDGAVADFFWGIPQEDLDKFVEDYSDLYNTVQEIHNTKSNIKSVADESAARARLMLGKWENAKTRFLQQHGLLLEKSAEGLTQNELLQVWTEAQHADMTTDKMLELMSSFARDGEEIQPDALDNVGRGDYILNEAEYYMAENIKTEANFWYRISDMHKYEESYNWLMSEYANNNPAFYINANGETSVSGRSLLEIKALTDKKLWAASLIKAKADSGYYARTGLGTVSVSVELGVKKEFSSGGAFEVYVPFMQGVRDSYLKRYPDVGAKNAAIRNTLVGGIDTKYDESGNVVEDPKAVEALQKPLAFFEEATGEKPTDATYWIDFVDFLLDRYSMSKELFKFRQDARITTATMREFLETPITIGRVEKVWGPGRKVAVNSTIAGAFEKGNPTMELSKETVLGFSMDTSGAGYGWYDPGNIVISVKPLDMLGDFGSPYDDEREVLVRKSLVYPAGKKMHTIFMDGITTTYANRILGDKNARYFQLDESAVMNSYDLRRIINIVDLLNEYRNAHSGIWRQAFVNGVLEGKDDGVLANRITEAINNSVYGKEFVDMVRSDNPFIKGAIDALLDKAVIPSGFKPRNILEECGDILAKLFNKPFIIDDAGKGNVWYAKGFMPELDREIASNGGVHLNDPQAKRTADVDAVLKAWKESATKAYEKNPSIASDNAGIMVDGNMVSISSLVESAETQTKLKNARDQAAFASDSVVMKNRLKSSPKDAPDPSTWNEDTETYGFRSYAEALANRPTYRNAQRYSAWLPAAVDAGMREFNAWRSQVFEVNHPDVNMEQLVESWDFVNYLIHAQDDIDIDAVNIDDVVGKTFVDSGGTEVTITQDVLDMYGEFDAFVRDQGARIAALQARGFTDDYNQLGYLPHTDYNPVDQSAEAMIQGVLWRKNKLKNSTNEDGDFTTEKLDNNWEHRYRTWLGNMSYDALGDVALFGEKMKELIADGVVTVNDTDGSGFVDKSGQKVNPQETLAKAITGDKDLNAQAAKTKSAKDFMKAHTDMNNKIDFKQLDADTAADAEKFGYSKALHDNYGDVYGNSTAKIVSQKNIFSSKITSLYDFMRSTATTDGSLLTHGGELLINPNGIAKDIVRRYRDGANLKEVVTSVLREKAGRTVKGAEYMYTKWLPDIQKHVNGDGTINSSELAALLTKHLRYEAWTAIKKWLARADYDNFNPATKKTLDNLLYRHNMVVQASNNPGVMKTINKAMNVITGARHRALFYLNPKNALLQLSECIRLFSDFKLGDATKALKRLSTDEGFRNTVAEWKDIVFPDREPLENVQPMADAWGKTAGGAKLNADGTLDIKNTIKGGIQEADAVAMAPINAAEDMKNTVIIAGIVQELETKKANGTLKEPDYDFVMRRFQRVALANDEFGRLGYTDNPFARTMLYLQNFSIRQLKMFGDNVVDSWGDGGLGKATGYIMKTFGWRMGLFLIMAKLGYSAGQVLGYDPFDLIGDDYTGLDEDDETELDRQIKSGWLSPLFAGGITSLIQNYYFAARQAYERSNEITPEEEASALAQGDDTWGLKQPETDWGELLTSWLPGGGAAKRWVQMGELLDKGVATSASGTKMYEAPNNLGDVIAGFTFGRGTTSNAREYYQAPDPLQGFLDYGAPGFIQQMGRAFSTGFREFDPIDRQNFTDWFDGTDADEQQWQSGYYYYRNKAKEIFDAYNSQTGYTGDADMAALKSSYREEMEKLGEELQRFSDAYVRKHGQLGGVKMQQLLNILNDAQTNLLMDDAARREAELSGLNRAQERYAQANLPAETRQTGPSTGSPDSTYNTRFSPQYYSAVQGIYGGSSEAAKILKNLYDTKWKNLRKEYSNRAFAKGTSYDDRERIQREYINIIRQDLDGVVQTYGASILNTDAVDDVLTDVFAGMIPYGDYNVNKKGRRVSLPENVEVDVSDWLLQRYANFNKAPSVGYSANARETLERARALKNSGRSSQAKAMARLLLQRVQDQRASLTRSELEELQGILYE